MTHVTSALTWIYSSFSELFPVHGQPVDNTVSCMFLELSQVRAVCQTVVLAWLTEAMTRDTATDARRTPEHASRFMPARLGVCAMRKHSRLSVFPRPGPDLVTGMDETGMEVTAEDVPPEPGSGPAGPGDAVTWPGVASRVLEIATAGPWVQLARLCVVIGFLTALGVAWRWL